MFGASRGFLSYRAMLRVMFGAFAAPHAVDQVAS
jgi:hypothetical protein